MDVIAILEMSYQRANQSIEEYGEDLDFLDGYYRGRADAFKHALNVLRAEELENEADTRF